MIVATIAFYLFAAVTIAAAFMVISARNPVHSVLFLILAFFSSAWLFVLMGAEFVAMILVIVYVGAVAVLFLFVVMMLDIDFKSLRSEMLNYLPLGGMIGIILLLELGLVASTWVFAPDAASLAAAPAPAADSGVTNAEALGRVIYTQYVYYFQAAGMILLVAMVGAIVLTLRKREGVKRQVIADQVARTPQTGVEVKKVEPGQGI
ncbi:NADH-ubiquinone/plastoquinone oxidoreductase chain 6 [Tepidicaulis marinus]|uniref:NADH-quinone oxidoreductase subunit J n=1 Tax=Tepidicaulis marinus TaxID=1333998 RepID=A0A081B942_9HYPH|nr:NADH-quinone oxidoreductase subunit J [Tepidicaulis marinus]GAK44560.1 NADH-ubiquinone/plastoquinone oxidoreductase chain 6 [Tepidicaulis marinus]